MFGVSHSAFALGDNAPSGDFRNDIADAAGHVHNDQLTYSVSICPGVISFSAARRMFEPVFVELTAKIEPLSMFAVGMDFDALQPRNSPQQMHRKGNHHRALAEVALELAFYSRARASPAAANA